jgi:hypothetical protein
MDIRSDNGLRSIIQKHRRGIRAVSVQGIRNVYLIVHGAFAFKTDGEYLAVQEWPLCPEGIPRPPNATDRHAMRSPSALRDVKLFRDACKHASQSEAREASIARLTRLVTSLIDVLHGGLAFNRTPLALRASRMAPPIAT